MARNLDEYPPRVTANHIKILRKNKRNCDWLDKYERMKSFYKRFRRFPKSKERWNAINIGMFKDRAREAYSKGKIKWWQFKLLDKIGFPFDPVHTPWEIQFQAIKRCWKSHPQCKPFIPSDYPQYQMLEKFIMNQREARQKGRLGNERIVLLDSIGFPWDHNEALWEHSYNLLRGMKGHFPSSVSDEQTEKRLYNWCLTQRRLRRRGKLSPEKIRKLDRIGFHWEPHDETWDSHFAALKIFVKRHRRLPKMHKSAKNEYLLAAWINFQKSLVRKSKLPEDRLERLIKEGIIHSDGG